MREWKTKSRRMERLESERASLKNELFTYFYGSGFRQNERHVELWMRKVTIEREIRRLNSNGKYREPKKLTEEYASIAAEYEAKKKAEEAAEQIMLHVRHTTKYGNVVGVLKNFKSISIDTEYTEPVYELPKTIIGPYNAKDIEATVQGCKITSQTASSSDSDGSVVPVNSNGG